MQSKPSFSITKGWAELFEVSYTANKINNTQGFRSICIEHDETGLVRRAQFAYKQEYFVISLKYNTAST